MPTYGNLISADWFHDSIYLHEKISPTIIRSFLAPAPPPAIAPSGLTFDGTNLISIDVNAQKIYVHQGITSTITNSFLAFGVPNNDQFGLAYDGINLISAGSVADLIYIHAGITGVLPASTFPTPGFLEIGVASRIRGLSIDSINLMSSDEVTLKIYHHIGVAQAVSSSFASPSTSPRDLAFDYDEGNLISCDFNADMIYVHSGITSTILESFPTPGPSVSGLTFDLPFFCPRPPTALHCCDLASSIGAEEECIPVRILRVIPFFSAIYNGPDAGDLAVYYQIQINTTNDFSGTLLWDSGKTSMASITEGQRSGDLHFTGDPLEQGITYYWRIRFWDDEDNTGAWSTESACFTIVSAPGPENLLCEQKKNPTDVTDPRPEFSAVHSESWRSLP